MRHNCTPTDDELTDVLSRAYESLLRWLFWATAPDGGPEPELVRFGPGDHTAPERVRWIARRKLLTAFQLEAPHLFADVLALARFQLATDFSLLNDDSWERPPDHPDPLGMLSLWGRTHNLPPEQAGSFLFLLFIEGVIQTLATAFTSVTGRTLEERTWAELRVRLHRRFVPSLHSGPERPEDPTHDAAISLPELTDAPLTFAFPAWDPGARERQSYADAARAAFERGLAAHLDGQNATYLSTGATTTPVKRRAHSHFRWYIRYQVLNESLGAIAKTEYATEGAVWHAIGEVVKLTGMPRRSGAKGGAPRGPRRQSRKPSS